MRSRSCLALLNQRRLHLIDLRLPERPAADRPPTAPAGRQAAAAERQARIGDAGRRRACDADAACG